MYNKKFFIFTLMMILAVTSVFAEEGGKEDEKTKFAAGYFEFEEESNVAVTDGKFDEFTTKISTIEGGVNLNLADNAGLVLTPYAGASDAKLGIPADSLNPAATSSGESIEFPVKFNGVTVYTGLRLALSPIEMIGLEFALYNTNNFGPAAHGDLGAAAGFGVSIGAEFEIEKAFLTIGLSDALEPTWAGVRGFDDKSVKTHLYNDFNYALRFNFFNFIKEDLNTGLFAEGELKTDSDWGVASATDYNNAEYSGTKLSHEFYLGLVTNPISWFEGYAAFAMFNENEYKPEIDSPIYKEKVMPQTWRNKFGIKLGTTFSVKNVSFSLEWLGKIGQFVKVNPGIPLDHADFKNLEWTQEGFTQEITFTVGVAIE